MLVEVFLNKKKQVHTSIKVYNEDKTTKEGLLSMLSKGTEQNIPIYWANSEAI